MIMKQMFDLLTKALLILQSGETMEEEVMEKNCRMVERNSTYAKNTPVSISRKKYKIIRK